MNNPQTTNCPKCGNFMAYNNDELQAAEVLECFHCPKEVMIAYPIRSQDDVRPLGANGMLLSVHHGNAPPPCDAVTTPDYADINDPVGCLIIDLSLILGAPLDETGDKLVAAKKRLREFMEDCYDIKI